MKKILVTGGAGFIGSHTCVELLNSGKEIIVVDNLSNSQKNTIDAIKKITGKEFKFYQINYLNKQELDDVFKENEIDSVINFAGYKSVGESVKEPLKYYINNICGCLNLLDIMKKYSIKKFVFSSSATVYGEKNKAPYDETMEIGATTNPYGTTKYMIERILQDLYLSDESYNIAILRYFNPIGAHETGLIGEDPEGIPNNLMPYIAKVAAGKLERLSVFGNDYPTKDGTGIRDYIHVVDLAIAHLKAIEKLNIDGKGMHIYNIGTGVGYSVLDVINTFERVNNVKIPYIIAPRRDGDVAITYANPQKAKEELGFETTKTIEDMCKDMWNFQKNV